MLAMDVAPGAGDDAMTNPEDIRMAVRRDVLVDRIQRIIERQTAIVPLSFQQVTDLQEAIAHFTADLLDGEKRRLLQ